MADEFACARCGAVLTVPVSRVALPVHAHQQYGHAMLPALMNPGTYSVDPEPSGPPWRSWSAIDPEPSGPPWRSWSAIDPDEAEARGVHAPVAALSFGAPGAVVVAPGDTRGTVLIPERCGGYCTGLDGRDGPNLACARCGRPVATRIDDCTFWQEVRFAPDAVRRRRRGPEAPPLDWEALRAGGEAIPPVEPSGLWHPIWSASVGAALAHLLVASAGHRTTVPGGLLAAMFGRSLDALLPAGSETRQAALVGPGLPAPAAADIALVPRHPQTGRAWRPPGDAETVPLAAGVWLYLAFGTDDRLLLTATGTCPTASCATTRPRRRRSSISVPTRGCSSTRSPASPPSATPGCAASTTRSAPIRTPSRSEPNRSWAGPNPAASEDSRPDEGECSPLARPLAGGIRHGWCARSKRRRPQRRSLPARGWTDRAAGCRRELTELGQEMRLS